MPAAVRQTIPDEAIVVLGLEMKSQLNPSLVAWTVDGHRPGIGNSSPDEP